MDQKQHLNHGNVESKVSELALKLDGDGMRKWVDGRVKQGVEEVLQAILEEESKMLCGAGPYERSEGRKDHRNGYRQRKLVTRVGEIALKVPRLRELAFMSSIVERYQRRECSVDEAMLEMYFAGVSTRKVEDITQALWGGKVSAQQMSRINAKLGDKITAWRDRPLTGTWPYVYLDGMILPRRWDGEVANVSILLAVGVNRHGQRDVLGVVEGSREDKASWLSFLRDLKQRGLTGVELVIADRCTGLVEAAREVFADARYQRCMVHFYRNVLTKVPKGRRIEVAAMLKAIYAQESKEEALVKAKRVIEQLRAKLPEAMQILEQGVPETMSFYRFPRTHWKRIRTNNPIERLIREIRRRTNVVGAFPDSKSALLLIAARAKYVAEKTWLAKTYMLFNQHEEDELAA
jgi:transposase-like protein